MKDLKQAFKQFIISMIGRRMVFAFITNAEKWALMAFIERGLTLSWEMVTLIICKDIVILALIGLVQFEKIQLKASVGNG
jgi:hypothetical protein